MFEFDIGYPFVIFVVVLVALFIWLTREPKFNPEPQPERINGDFTYDQLAEFDGVKKPQTFLALKHNIYDVTGSSFYSKDGAYGLFAGRDASVNLSKMSHDQTLLNRWGSYTLNEEETQTLNDWVARFEAKYRKVGKVLV